MQELTKKELLDKLVENEFITAEQSKGFEKLTQEELIHLVKSSEVVIFLEKGKSDAENQVKELSEKVSTLQAEKKELQEQLESVSYKIESKNKEVEELLAKLETFNTEVEAEPIKAVPGLTFEFRNEKYKFKDTAPKKIRYNNQIFTQKELIKNEAYQDYLIELIGGGSNLIEKI